MPTRAPGTVRGPPTCAAVAGAVARSVPSDPPETDDQTARRLRRGRPGRRRRACSAPPAAVSRSLTYANRSVGAARGRPAPATRASSRSASTPSPQAGSVPRRPEALASRRADVPGISGDAFTIPGAAYAIGRRRPGGLGHRASSRRRPGPARRCRCTPAAHRPARQRRRRCCSSRAQTNGANVGGGSGPVSPVAGRLVAVRDLDQGRLAAGGAPERHGDRQPGGQPGRHGEQRVAGDRRRRGAGAGVRLGVDQVDRASPGAYDGVTSASSSCSRSTASMPSSRPCAQAAGPRLGVLLAVDAGTLQRLLEQRLPEVRELDVGVLAVEGDHVGQGARAVAGAGRRGSARRPLRSSASITSSSSCPSKSVHRRRRSVSSTIVAPSAASSATARSAASSAWRAVAPVRRSRGTPIRFPASRPSTACARSRCRRRRARRAARPRRAPSSPSGRGSPASARPAPRPSVGTRPTVGLSPTQPLNAAGQEIEPSVSVPTANGAMPGRRPRRRCRSSTRRRTGSGRRGCGSARRRRSTRRSSSRRGCSPTR